MATTSSEQQTSSEQPQQQGGLSALDGKADAGKADEEHVERKSEWWQSAVVVTGEIMGTGEH